MLVIECYDPTTSSYKFVKEVFLFKNEDYEPFIKLENSTDFIRDTSFATNGATLFVQTSKRAYYFDMKTGIKQSKVALTDE
jgi:hypothetical protein